VASRARSALRRADNAWPELLNLTVRWHLEFIEQRSTGESNPLNFPAFPGPAGKPALRAPCLIWRPFSAERRGVSPGHLAQT
jgi:hypothetical protein